MIFRLKPLAFSAKGLADLSETRVCQGFRPRIAVYGRSGGQIPISFPYGGIVPADAPPAGEKERHGMLGDLIQTVGGHIGHGYAETSGSLNINVVDADPIAPDHLQFLAGLNHLRRDFREAGPESRQPRRPGVSILLPRLSLPQPDSLPAFRRKPMLSGSVEDHV